MAATSEQGAEPGGANQPTFSVGVPRETFPGERRVALVPAAISSVVKLGAQVVVESGAGIEAGFPDEKFAAQGATVVDRRAVFAADVLLQVRSLGANPQAGQSDLPLLRSGQIVIGMADPLGMPRQAAQLAETGVSFFGLELIPRTTRAQSMDVLSSMATIAGYRAVLLAATTLPKMFPLLTTAAGTITPAKVLVVGAGVAGLQAIATARRLGAVVSAYDVRAAAKEQVNSLGAKFVEMELSTAEGQGGYARQMDEAFYQRQRELMQRVVAENDVVITTAAVPGKKAPILVTAQMIAGMQPGSVIVDVAAERGGNCELTRPGVTMVEHGVTILGPANLASEIPQHASQMFARNVATFLALLVKDGKLTINTDDEIVRETLVARDGRLVNPKITSPTTAQASP
jgi:H+-translocating NAD(P) transhydrogenase subunit alpha